MNYPNQNSLWANIHSWGFEVDCVNICFSPTVGEISPSISIILKHLSGYFLTDGKKRLKLQLDVVQTPPLEQYTLATTFDASGCPIVPYKVKPLLERIPPPASIVHQSIPYSEGIN
jgi:hypothetical protein